ncbi:hypothetical protein [Streptomyces sp. NPDC005907]|uniref:hypothetical protein n=1 Tax=Streptomyces sp. NPDC005907 TaxID=3154571 RepID=UPI0033C19CE7
MYDDFVAKHGVDKDSQAFDAGDDAAETAGWLSGVAGIVLERPLGAWVLGLHVGVATGFVRRIRGRAVRAGVRATAATPVVGAAHGGHAA